MDRLPWESKYDVPPVSKEEFLAGRGIRFATSNPEQMKVPFWEMMIRTGWSGFAANELYKADPFKGGPTWCFARMGGTTTVFEDRFVVHIGGEHEDWYDPDFQIYNDVVVRDFEGNIWVYGYPTSVFPPTDFHTATFIETYPRGPADFNETIVIVGGLGYEENREFWRTPVYALDLKTMAIRQLEIGGEGPGWIWKHQASRFEPGKIKIWGGNRLDKKGEIASNTREAILDLWSLSWIA